MPPALLNLPAEIHAEIASYLSGRDVKNLRLVSTKALERFPLKLSRVFLSPNKADIRVFRKVSQHETLRHQIVELIWDHTYFPELRSMAPGKIGSDLLDMADFLTRCELETAKARVRQKRFSQSGLQLPDQMKRPEADKVEWDFPVDFSKTHLGTLSACKCIQIYKKLARRQTKNIESEKDLRALSDYILRFPRLEKITVCHATQGWLFEPFYDTPTTRLLPRGFRHRKHRSDSMWARQGASWPEMKTVYSKYIRGYIGILSVLASIGNNLEIEELSIQSNGLPYGLTAHMFNRATPEYLDFVELLSRPTFRRLDLVLDSYNQEIHWPGIRSGHLRDALGQVVNLQHFSLTADMLHLHPWITSEDWTPLNEFIPIDLWPLLQSFRLMDILVKQDDLVTFLGALPLSVRIIELGQLSFVDGHGDYATLLDLIKHQLHWSDRQVAKQPRLTIIVAISDFAPPGMMNWIDSEVQEFIYNHGRTPFRGPRGPADVDAGVGVERDAFNPDHEWPHRDDFDWEQEVRIMRRQNYRLSMNLDNYLEQIAWGPDVSSSLQAARDESPGPWEDDDIDNVHYDISFDIE
uniref:F-box domain-containing protein n=1 Tax=Bionectria ochroleuca TaxID=29856 RepID=A0A8H7N3E0_BIOOC